jgi:hypothetical protein
MGATRKIQKPQRRLEMISKKRRKKKRRQRKRRKEKWRKRKAKGHFHRNTLTTSVIYPPVSKDGQTYEAP